MGPGVGSRFVSSSLAVNFRAPYFVNTAVVAWLEFDVANKYESKRLLRQTDRQTDGQTEKPLLFAAMEHGNETLQALIIPCLKHSESGPWKDYNNLSGIPLSSKTQSEKKGYSVLCERKQSDFLEGTRKSDLCNTRARQRSRPAGVVTVADPSAAANRSKKTISIVSTSTLKP